MNDDDFDISDINFEDMNDDEVMAVLDKLNEDTDQPIEINDDDIVDDGHTCVHCKTADLLIEDFSLGIVVCSGCGNVVGDLYDEKPEQRDYGEEGNKN